MIRLAKLDCPTILLEKATEWQSEYTDAVSAGVWPSEAAKTRYRHPEIKVTLQRETAEKCAYCESKITHVYPGDCEHILPKSHRPDMVVEWTNLTLVCSECNRRKSDYYEPSTPLVNPYVELPEEHLRWYGPVALPAPGSTKGRLSVRQLGLSRSPLVERRTDRIMAVRNLIELWEIQEDAAYRKVLWAEIVRETSADREYSACAKEFVLTHLGLTDLTESAAEIAHSVLREQRMT